MICPSVLIDEPRRIWRESRLAAGAGALRRWASRPPNAALLAVCLAWATVIALVLQHSIFVTNDSLNNYAHVWYVSQRLWHDGVVPLHMRLLGHGNAFAFPYAFLPWVTAALVRPLLGDWAVTLWLVLGFLGVVAATWWAFPELRGGWWTAALLANPMLAEGLLLGQMPFLWATALLFAAVACWRRDRRLVAAVLLGLAQATHPAVVLPLAGVMVAARLYWERRRAQLLGYYLVSLAIAAPAAWFTLASPAAADVSAGALVSNFFNTVTLRAFVIAGPFIGLLVLRTPLRRYPAVILASLLALNAALVPVRHNEFAWTALGRSPDPSLMEFVGSEQFVPGATYRILRVADGKVGMYQLVQHGGRLDADFFPETIGRRSWQRPDDYVAFLRRRAVDYVIIYGAYDRRYRTNEHELLESLAAQPAQPSNGPPLCTALMMRSREYDVYQVVRQGCGDGQRTRSSSRWAARSMYSSATARSSADML